MNNIFSPGGKPLLFAVVLGSFSGWTTDAIANHDITFSHVESSLKIDFNFDETRGFHHLGGSDSGLSYISELEVGVSRDRNRNLAIDNNRDEWELTTEYDLIGVVRKSERLQFFGRLKLGNETGRRNPDPRESVTEFSLKSIYARWRLSGDNEYLTVGRQELVDQRLWLFDEDIDGISYVWQGKDRAWQAVIGREELFREDLIGEHDKEKPNIYLLRYYRELAKKRQASLYLTYVDGRGFNDDERSLYLGARSFGRFTSDVKYWAEGAFLFGRTGPRRVNAYGFDVGFTKTATSLDNQPYLSLGLAYGSGDDGKGSDSAFRQTGLHANKERFGGFTNTRYYGQVFNPELNNMLILTAGVGMKPQKNLSIDVIYHRYMQAKLSDELRDSRIRNEPNGLSRDLGSEIDFVLSLREGRMLSMELILGVFYAGDAFGTNSGSTSTHAELVFKGKF